MTEDDLDYKYDIEAIEKEMMEELKKPPGKRILVCPVCGSSDVTYYLGLKWDISTSARNAIMWEH